MPIGPIRCVSDWRVTRIRWRLGPLLRVNLLRRTGYNYPAPGFPAWFGAERKRGWRISF